MDPDFYPETPGLDDKAKETLRKDFVKKNCLLIHHETGSGRSLLCQTRDSAMQTKLLAVLNENVASIANNCEFLARHVRFEREKIKRFMMKVKKAGLA